MGGFHTKQNFAFIGGSYFVNSRYAINKGRPRVVLISRLNRLQGGESSFATNHHGNRMVNGNRIKIQVLIQKVE